MSGYRTRARAVPVVLLVLVLLARLPSVWAQTEQALPKTVTLEDALNYANEHYPAVRASLEQLNAARAGVSLARTQYLPQLSGVYQASRATQNQVSGIWLPSSITPTVIGPTGDYTGQSYWGSQAIGLFSWEPLDFGLRPANVELAKSGQEKASSEVAVTRLQWKLRWATRF